MHEVVAYALSNKLNHKHMWVWTSAASWADQKGGRRSADHTFRLNQDLFKVFVRSSIGRRKRQKFPVKAHGGANRVIL